MKIEINEQEIKALDELMRDAKVPIAMGMILGLFRTKIQQEYNKEQKNLIKKQFAEDSKAVAPKSECTGKCKNKDIKK